MSRSADRRSCTPPSISGSVRSREPWHRRRCGPYPVAVVQADDIAYSVRRSDRARRVRVTVDVAAASRSCCRAARPSARPRRRSASCGPGSSGGWPSCERTRAAVAARGDTVPYLGRRADAGRPAGAHAGSPPRRRAARARPATQRGPALERWYRRAARERDRARAWTAPARRPRSSYTRLTIRGQRTRWASCSHTGAMSFNWRLLLRPRAGARLRRLARGLPPAR